MKIGLMKFRNCDGFFICYQTDDPTPPKYNPKVEKPSAAVRLALATTTLLAAGFLFLSKVGGNACATDVYELINLCYFVSIIIRRFSVKMFPIIFTIFQQKVMKDLLSGKN